MKSRRCADAAAQVPALEVILAPPQEPTPARTLARFAFDDRITRGDDPREIALQLGGSAFAPLDELWLGRGEVICGVSDGFQFAHDGSLLFASYHIPERALMDVEQVARASYVHLHGLLARLGYPHWLRLWNYLSQITAGRGDAERYRLFNVGRYRALTLTPTFESGLPAASAIGTDRGGFTLCCLAGRSPGVQVENPRQISAFNYPRQYGPRSPSFSRATFLPGCHGKLLVSGTASIVGHESRHVGDPVAQLEETARNVRALLDAAMLEHAPGVAYSDAALSARPETGAQALRVYLRPPLDAAVIRPHVERLFGARTPCVYIAGEICRAELALEIEGVFTLPDGESRSTR